MWLTWIRSCVSWLMLLARCFGMFVVSRLLCVGWPFVVSSVNGCCDNRFDAPAPEQTGRATCGESEGREFVSNYNPMLVQGVKCVEYWGRSHSSPVPRVFGGASA